MDFRWTEVQDKLYDQILRFARENLNDRLKKQRGTWLFRKDIWQLCGKQGLLGLCVPKYYGGRGLDALSTARAMEAFGHGCEDMGLVFSIAAHLFACAMPIAEYGSVELKEKLLPPLCSGELIGANAITESEAGSDAFALKTRAEREGTSYILTGIKSYVTNGPIADVIIIYASEKPKHGYMGISAFALEKKTSGLRIGEQLNKMGLASALASSLSLERCPVSEENRLGVMGQGAQVFRGSMQWERSCLFAAYVGMMDRQLDQTIAYARRRQQFGKTISNYQAVSHRIVQMKLRLEAARLLLYRACWLFDQGQNAVMDVSLAKLAVSEAAIQSSLDAIQIHGSVGYDTETGLEQMLRDSIPSTIFSGTSEIQRDLIAREIGL